MSVDKIFISSFFNTEKFAEYANGAMELPFIGIITGSIMAVLMPEFVKLYDSKNIKAFIKIWDSSIKKVAFIFFPLMCFLFIFSEQFIIIFFSEKYLESVNIFRIYLLQLPCKITILGIILLSMNQTSFVLKSTLLYLAFNILLNFIFINALGIIGPAIATIISLYIISFLQLVYISIKFKIKFSQIFPWGILMKLIVISISSGIIIHLISFKSFTFFNQGLLNNSAIILVGLACYVSVFLFIGVITKTFNKNSLSSFNLL